MKLKKILIVILSIIILSGCTKIDDMSYDNIVNNIGNNIKKANVYRNGYKFYLPKGLSIKDASFNYAIISSLNYNYYIYFDLLAYNENSVVEFNSSDNVFYSKRLFFGNIDGYIEIKKQENNQYLIEIMYNYAKIEVMVDEDQIKEALINSISILNSIKYDKITIENLLKDDNLNFTEEIFDMFEKVKKHTDVLNYTEVDENIEEVKEDIKDTDFLN